MPSFFTQKLIFYYLLFFAVLVGKVSAQISPPDSLRNLISQELGQVKKSALIIQLAEEMAKQSRDSIVPAIRLLKRDYEKSMDEEKRQDQVFTQLNHLGLIALLFSKIGNLDSAAYYYKLELERVEETDLYAKKATFYQNLGAVAGMKSQFEESIAYFEKSLTNYQLAQDTNQMAILNIQLGASYYIQGNFSRAVDFLLHGYGLLENGENYEKQLLALEVLVDLYTSLDQRDKSLEFLQKQKATQIKKYRDANNPYLNLIEGRIALYEGKYKEGIELLNTYILKMNPHPSPTLASIYYFLGEGYLNIGQQDSALKYFDRFYALSPNSSIPILNVKSLLGKGEIFAERGNATEAIDICKDALSLASRTTLPLMELNATNALADLYKQTGNIEQAFVYMSRGIALKDSIYNNKQMQTLARMEADMEFEKERQRMAFEKEQETLKQKNIRSLLLIGLTSLIIILVVGAIYLRSKQRSNLKLSGLNQALLLQKGVVEEQKEKLELLDDLKSQFFTNISHEFRTPLTIISGMASQMKEQPERWTEKGIEMIRRNTDNLLDLVNQILELQKLESNELKIAYVQGDIVSYIKYLTSSFHSLTESQGIDMQFTSEVPSLKMDYDPEKMLRIISNLLSNSVKFTAATEERDKSINLTLTQKQKDDKPYLSISVQDTGTGIPEEKLNHIFDRFYQADPSEKRVAEGTGIGLALTLELVKLMGGDIEVSSCLGEGTTFIVLLPITNHSEEIADLPSLNMTRAAEEKTSSDPMPSPIEEEGEALASAKPEVLIVEDNSDVQQYLVACLQDQYRLRIANDGQEGIDQAIESVPDLIVSDVMMPRKDGYELCDTLKRDQRTSHIPIILLTAKADQESKLSGLKKGADAYLTKPFDAEELLIRLDRLLQIRQRLKERYATPMAFRKPEPALELEDSFIAKVVELIHENMDNEEFGTSQLAEKLYMSRSQVHNKLKALSGQSTSHFIRSIRLGKAKEFLQSHELNISEIAYEVGFSNPTYFSRIFNKQFGMTPSQFRESLG